MFGLLYYLAENIKLLFTSLTSEYINQFKPLIFTSLEIFSGSWTSRGAVNSRDSRDTVNMTSAFTNSEVLIVNVSGRIKFINPLKSCLLVE